MNGVDLDGPHERARQEQDEGVTPGSTPTHLRRRKPVEVGAAEIGSGFVAGSSTLCSGYDLTGVALRAALPSLTYTVKRTRLAPCLATIWSRFLRNVCENFSNVSPAVASPCSRSNIFGRAAIRL